MPKRRLRRLALGLGALAALTLVAPPAASAANTDEPMSPGCRPVDTTVPSSVLEHQVVSIPGANLLNQGPLKIHGRLCLPPGGAPKTVLLALHGITYTNSYWDVQYQPETYSFARQMMSAGYAVFAIDRLGYGRSDHPLSALVTLDSQAEVAHQVLQQLKAGKIGATPFSHVVLVGHSYGSATSWLESSEYNDADAAVTTGWGSTIETLPVARFFSGFYPAVLDQKFASSGYDPGYLTPMPGARNQNFLYDLDNADPGLIDYDQNTMRDTVTAGEGATFIDREGAIPVTYLPTTSKELELPLSTHTKNIKVPMFLLDGVSDLFFCGADRQYCNSGKALQQHEGQFFSPAACLQTAVMPNAGHDLNLQRNAQQSYAVLRAWIDRAVGPTGANVGTYRASCQPGS
ncbi:MAG TPA: alpha/beta hydrolase [Amycolatopsis sp.]|nr:alpha/beta hydrolase [Amycolatopsis sp.]